MTAEIGTQDVMPGDLLLLTNHLRDGLQGYGLILVCGCMKKQGQVLLLTHWYRAGPGQDEVDYSKVSWLTLVGLPNWLVVERIQPHKVATVGRER